MTDAPPSLAHLIVVDHEKHAITIDGQRFPHHVSEDVFVNNDGPLHSIDITVLANRVVEVGHPPIATVPDNATVLGNIDGTILIRIGSGEAAEVGAFTIPIHASTREGNSNLRVTTSTDRLQRAIAAFGAAMHDD